MFVFHLFIHSKVEDQHFTSDSGHIHTLTHTAHCLSGRVWCSDSSASGVCFPSLAVLQPELRGIPIMAQEREELKTVGSRKLSKRRVRSVGSGGWAD